MVNSPSSTVKADRRERPRASVESAFAFGAPKLNPFGDLHSVQHLSARLARSLRPVFEALLRRELRLWAEPLVVQRFADYRAERPEGLTAWLPMAVTPSPASSPGIALAVFDGRFVLEMLDLFFGGTGEAPKNLPGEFLTLGQLRHAGGHIPHRARLALIDSQGNLQRVLRQHFGLLSDLGLLVRRQSW